MCFKYRKIVDCSITKCLFNSIGEAFFISMPKQVRDFSIQSNNNLSLRHENKDA